MFSIEGWRGDGCIGRRKDKERSKSSTPPFPSRQREEVYGIGESGKEQTYARRRRGRTGPRRKPWCWTFLRMM